MGIPGVEWSPKIGKTTFAAKGKEEQTPKILITVVKGENIISSVRENMTYNVNLTLNRANAVLRSKTGKSMEYSMGGLILDKELFGETLIKMAGDIMLAYTKETSPKIRKDLLNAHTSILEKMLLIASDAPKQ